MPLQKLNKNYKTVLTFLILILLELLIISLFSLPLLSSIFHTTLFTLLHLLTLLTFFTSCTLDPGFLKSKYEFQNLLNKIDPVYLCPDCNVVRTPNSRHCNLCNHCVEKFDHHCPYLNNWVGYRNHLPFVAFLFFLMGVLVEMFLVLGVTLKEDFEEHPIGVLKGDNGYYMFLVLAIVAFVVGGFFFIFVFLLFVTHVIKVFWLRTNPEARFRFDNEERKDERTNTVGSFFQSEILVQTDGATGDEIPKIRRYRTTNDSIIEEIEKTELLEGNYVSDMDYSSAKNLQTKKGYLKVLMSKICYKPPNQSQAYAFVAKQMVKDKMQ